MDESLPDQALFARLTVEAKELLALLKKHNAALAARLHKEQADARGRTPSSSMPPPAWLLYGTLGGDPFQFFGVGFTTTSGWRPPLAGGPAPTGGG